MAMFVVVEVTISWSFGLPLLGEASSSQTLPDLQTRTAGGWATSKLRGSSSPCSLSCSAQTP